MKIVTNYWRKPIPFRHYDWEATLDGYEGGDPIGFGATAHDAIKDLEEQIHENADECAPDCWCCAQEAARGR